MAEKFAEKWFQENGFEFVVIKQFISKTKYEVIKDGTKDMLELPYGITDYKKYMELYKKSFDMLVKINEMKKQL